MTTPKYPVMELSPPYGDDTMDFYYWGIVNLFSLPYGDGTEFKGQICRVSLFSPPYGDGTLPVNKFHDYFTFSPPYGEAGAQRLRGFCRDKLKSAGILQNHQRGLVFVPLRG